METYFLDHDIKAICGPAASFPNGVLAAHTKMHELLPADDGRKFFGISWGGPNGSIIYKAGAEEMHVGEAEERNCETFLIKKGNYMSVMINDFKSNVPAIGGAFHEMLANPGIDPQGACIEWYHNDNDLQCMVRLAD